MQRPLFSPFVYETLALLNGSAMRWLAAAAHRNDESLVAAVSASPSDVDRLVELLVELNTCVGVRPTPDALRALAVTHESLERWAEEHPERLEVASLAQDLWRAAQV